jgi:glycosyltransferase involved in cell wall biosynthesis
VRVLLVQQSLDPPGGGNAVAAWMLQALVGQHAVSTVTMTRWHPSRVDEYYGTSLRAAAIAQLHPSRGWQALRKVPGELTRLRMAVLFRAARQVQRDFDLLITADNYGAFEQNGIQYLHYPAGLRPAPIRMPVLVHGYYHLCDALSGLSWETARRNETLANSRWTAALLAGERGIAARVLYPPVVDPGAGLPWAQRQNTFLCVGRFHGSKRFELVIDILARAREHLRDLRLHIVGSNVDREYASRMRARAGRYADWITIDEDLPQAELLALMARSRYGLHAMVDEHFGMAVAELARAGCIVFVHDSGGQVEAIGGLPELRWSTEDEAVARIRDVAADGERQAALSARLRSHAERFSTERFVQEFRAIVDNHGTAMALKRGSRNSSA